VKVKKLIVDLPIKVASGSKEVEINGICAHSKKVAPGNLFIAKSESYIPEALAAGAIAILSDFYDPSLPKELVQLVAEDVEALLPILASRFFAEPSKQLYCIAITGTNGKTTTSYLIKHLLEKLEQRPCGLIGTIEYIVGDHHYPAELTTPDVITCQKLLAEMVRQDCLSMVMETSSHGIVQGRTKSIDFDAAIFTNLTQDHLDYHGTMQEYANAKALLFTHLKEEAVAILNKESPYAEMMMQKCRASCLTYGFSKDADLFAHHIELYPDRSHFSITYLGQTEEVRLSMAGRHNILNAQAAIALCCSKGYALEEVVCHLSDFAQVPGRLERVEVAGGLHVYVDYAHTPDALENVLKALRQFCKGKLFLVFGAGGGRDPSKRKKMGEIACRLADFSFVTTDNPRKEDPSAICTAITEGFSSSNYCVELDRRKAIELAIKRATPEDFILVSGKGHETYQIFSHKTLPFDDRKVAKEILEEVLPLV